MTFLSRFLTTLVFLLACLTGGALFVHIFTGSPIPAPVRSRAMTRSLPVDTSVPMIAPVLSRFSLLPVLTGEKPLVAVVIENHPTARPHQRGLQDALLIEEFFVEGYISRFAAIFDARRLPPLLGPVRSLRPYFIDALVPLVHVILHAGGSPEAFERVRSDSSITAINGLKYSKEFFRDDSVPAPHNLFTGALEVSPLLPAEITPASWPPYATGMAQTGEPAVRVSVNFYNPDNDVAYTYDPQTWRYIRKNGEEVSDAQPSNVLLLEIPVAGEGEAGRLQIPVAGEGRAFLFRSGVEIEGTWKKYGPQAWFVFTDHFGHPMVFARGQTWMTVVDRLERVKWE
ncbi:MAG: DUF3048 domain-containing protein [Candidatus Peregrinibacteria bacterium]